MNKEFTITVCIPILRVQIFRNDCRVSERVQQERKAQQENITITSQCWKAKFRKQNFDWMIFACNIF